MLSEFEFNVLKRIVDEHVILVEDKDNPDDIYFRSLSSHEKIEKAVQFYRIGIITVCDGFAGITSYGARQMKIYMLFNQALVLNTYNVGDHVKIRHIVMQYHERSDKPMLFATRHTTGVIDEIDNTDYVLTYAVKFDPSDEHAGGRVEWFNVRELKLI